MSPSPDMTGDVIKPCGLYPSARAASLLQGPHCMCRYITMRESEL